MKTYLLRCPPLAEAADYRLVGADRASPPPALAEVACGQFRPAAPISAPGLGAGKVPLIEDLAVGGTGS